MADKAKRKPRTPRKPEESVPMRARQMLAKARVLAGTEVEESEALDAIETANQQFGTLGATVPRYDPESLLRYVEITPHLRPSIDAMAQNIDGYGFRAQPVEPWMLDLDSDEATEAIRQALEIEAWVSVEEEAMDQEREAAEAKEALLVALDRLDEVREKKRAPSTIRKAERAVVKAQAAADEFQEVEPEEPPPEGEEEATEDGITSEAVEEAREMIRLGLRREGYLFDAWFKNCCSDRSFIQLRRHVREDIKSHGWGAVELLRDGYGRLKRLAYVPGYTVRPMVERGGLVQVAEDDSVTPLSEGREVMVNRRFRTYVQIVGSQKVYYKSPGDPRVVSRTTGKTYKDLRALRRPKDAEPPGEGKDAEPANELLYVAEHDPTSPCPPPVWIGNLVSVLGVREADETNYFYLADKAIPAGLIFVHGGRIPKGTRQRLESRIKNELAGAQGSGKLLVVEANPTGKAPNERSVLPSISFESLRQSMQNDALFTTYDERTADRIGASFRLSPLLRGYTPDNLNRATAFAALYFAEQQVFQPERDEFDWTVNKYLLPEIGVRFSRFVSNSPPTRSAEELGKLIQATAPHGGWDPNEIREVIGDALNRPMAKKDEEWAKMPMVLTLSGAGKDQAAPSRDAGPLTSDEVRDVGQRLRQIESQVSRIVTEELRTFGYEADVATSFIDPPESDDEAD